MAVWSALPAVARVRPSGANATPFATLVWLRRVLKGEVEMRVCWRLAWVCGLTSNCLAATPS
jgi:hypothetical protein